MKDISFFLVLVLRCRFIANWVWVVSEPCCERGVLPYVKKEGVVCARTWRFTSHVVVKGEGECQTLSQVMAALSKCSR